MNTILCRSLILLILIATSAFAQVDDQDSPVNDAFQVDRSQSIEDYVQLIEQVLPNFGPDMLIPSGVRPSLFDEISPERVAGAFSDLPPEQVVQGGGEVLAISGDDRRVVKIDRVEGRLRWINKDRRPQLPGIGQPVEPGMASDLALQTAELLGIPTNETMPLEPRVVWMGIDGTGDDAGEALPAQTMVDLMRQVNGYPVFESLFRLTINNEGLPARALLRWPRIQVPEGLELRPRPVVVEQIALEMFEMTQGAEIDATIKLAYAPLGRNFVPAAVVAFDEKVTGEILVMPLVDLPPDTDRDGIADANDNCIDRYNPEQQDGDGDGVGDACDNCPATPNPGQFDDDEDGLGDACEEPEGSCVLPSGDCDDMTRALCAAADGTWKGEGSTCVPRVATNAAGTPLVRPLTVAAQPNPFNPKTTIRFEIGTKNLGAVAVDVVDVRGRVVRTLLKANVNTTGPHVLTWDGTDDNGARVASGIYMVRVLTPGETAVQKVALIK